MGVSLDSIFERFKEQKLKIIGDSGNLRKWCSYKQLIQEHGYRVELESTLMADFWIFRLFDSENRYVDCFISQATNQWENVEPARGIEPPTG